MRCARPGSSQRNRGTRRPADLFGSHEPKGRESSGRSTEVRRETTGSRRTRRLWPVAVGLSASFLMAGGGSAAQAQVDLPGEADDRLRDLVPKVGVPAPPSSQGETSPQRSTRAQARPPAVGSSPPQTSSQPRGGQGAAIAASGNPSPQKPAAGASPGGGPAEASGSAPPANRSDDGGAPAEAVGGALAEPTAERGQDDNPSASGDEGNPVTRFLAEDLPFTGGPLSWLALLGVTLGVLGLGLQRTLGRRA
jgi:hypothetical protein